MIHTERDQCAAAVADFLAKAANHRTMRQWLHCGHLTAYVRFNERYLREGLVGLCLVIANVVVDESHRRQGHLKRFLQTAAEVATVAAEPPTYLYIENVMEHSLAEYLRRSGWMESRPIATSSPSFFKLVSEIVAEPHTS